ncbi:glutamine--fructose-6-phosphate transaminase (isomerizing) [Candidatus Parcubacteria bacterium]|nr:MAG: glutamine--fructose-6-phosphate transaminase (isomerizing) [Candidatus Parcubacteria bacterium]
MCGIFGYVGKDPRGIEIILKGLDGLAHRGYDSMGMAIRTNNGYEVYKKAKSKTTEVKAKDIKAMIKNTKRECFIGIGHTRWATFGPPTDENAHPHTDQHQQFFLVHNGNLDNYHEIKELMKKKKIKLKTETDTEMIVNLIALNYRDSLEEALAKTLNLLNGAHALLVMSKKEPQKLVAAAKGGSLLAGKIKDGFIITSDPLAFPSSSQSLTPLEDGEIITLTADGWQTTTTNKLKQNDLDKLAAAFRSDTYRKGRFKYYMEKEIFEQPKILRNIIGGRLIHERGIPKLGGIEEIARELRDVETFHFVGCGTAYNACCYAVTLLGYFGIEARAWIASEFSNGYPTYKPKDVFVFVSQSGETADTISALEEVTIKGNLKLGIVNVVGSKIARLTDHGIYIRAGEERGVASTKAFTAQLMTIAMLGLFLARQRRLNLPSGKKIISALQNLPHQAQKVLVNANKIKQLTKKLRRFHNYYFLGHNFSLITAQEGALKLKEISYVHAESYPLGEMKHGPLALVDKNFCCVVIIPEGKSFQKGLINIRELKARQGKVIAVTTQGKKEVAEVADEVIYLPSVPEFLSPILATVPLQLFALFMALELGKNPDKPRNLAKTVTVG